MNSYLFKDRKGTTPLPEEFKRDLIPKNIQLAGELDEHEENNIEDGLIWLEDFQGEPCDCLFWLKLHKKMFGKVWTWAGKFRNHELANTDFDHPGYVRENLKKLEGDLKFWIESGDLDKKEILARFHERFLTIHPFANGNGRTSRILTEYIAKRTQLPVPTWGLHLRTDQKKHRQTYIESVVKARSEQDFSSLIEFMFS